MFDRRRSRSRRPWWLWILAIGLVVLVVILAQRLGPLRDVTARVTQPVQQVLYQAGSTVRDFFSNLGDVATLRTRNQELEAAVTSLTVENLRLKEIEAENARLRKLLDFTQINPSYDYKGSQVVGRVTAAEPTNVIQSIMIDLGSREGIKPGMPVVTERGLVGRITDVYATASRVLLLTDSNSNIDAMLQNGRQRGVLHGRAGLSPVLDYLPPNVDLLVGDIVITSGEGGNFPKGIPVGQIVEVQRNDVEMFQQAIVRTTVDFNTLETVLVITNFVPLEDVQNLSEN